MVNFVILVAQMRMLVVARRQHELYPLVLFILFITVEQDILGPIQTEHASLFT